MATQPRLVNKQFNTPINLYSRQNVQEVLDRETQILANGAIGIDFRNNPTVDKPGNLKNSAVLRMLEEEENRQRNGFGPGNEVARPLRENITWPPPEYEHKNQLRSTFKDVVTTGSKRVAWPPPNESGLDGLEPENNQQLHKGAPQYSTTAQSPPSPNNQRHPIQNQPARAPLRPLDVSQRDASPLASPLANQSPRGWAPVHSPTHFQTAHQPVTQQTFLGQQYQPSAQKYQAPPPAQQPYQAPPAQQYQAPPLAQQQYQAAPAQQYQAPPPAQQQYQAPLPTQQRYQAAPSPAQQYQVPPTQPPYQASSTQQQYQASPPVQQYKAAPSSPQQYRPVSQQSSETYQVSSQQYQTGPSQQYQQSHQSQTSYQTSSQQYQVSTQYNVSQQAPQVSRQVSSSTSAQVTPQSRPVVEPPPSTITLRPQPPINQAPPPLITSQPATATLKGGKHLRGDLKWPPENVKKQFEEENKMRLELARGPVFRPKKPNKDYSEFFEQHRLNSTYPGYKIPPGTQFYRPA